jgi:hypothetical protein
MLVPEIAPCYALDLSGLRPRVGGGLFTLQLITSIEPSRVNRLCFFVSSN